MQNVASQIHAILNAEFSPTELHVSDDSAKHAGHSGARPQGETHFSVKIVSPAFQGMSRVARHRAVYAPLQPLFNAGLHALAIDATAPGDA